MADWLSWDGGALTADVVTSYSADASAELTEHPIETGSVITDHQLRRPKTLTVEFAQSKQTLREDEMVWTQVDAPYVESRFQPTGLLLLSTALEAGLKAIGSAIGLIGGGDTLTIWSLTAKDPDLDRVQELHDQLLDLLEGATECTFSYQGLELTGYYITSVRRSTRAGSGGLTRFTLELQHVQTVATAASSLAGGLAVPGILSAIPSIDFGKKPGYAKVEENQYQRSLGANDIGANLLGGSL